MTNQADPKTTPFHEASKIHDVADVTHRNPVAVEVSNGRKDTKLDVRHWYFNDEREAYCRTQKGVQVLIEDVPALIETMIAVYNQACSPDKKLALA